MKKLLSLMLALVMIVGFVQAVPFSVNAVVYNSGYYVYEVVYGEAIIIEANPGLKGNITIPSYLGKFPVVAIEPYAFWGNEELTGVTIPEGVISIGASAFEACSNITKVTIPSSLTYVGEDGFYGCSMIEDVYISDPSAWCNIYFANASAKPLAPECQMHILNKNGYEVTNVVLDNRVTEIPHMAFYGCRNLEKITIPDSVTWIGDWAFANCSSLNNVSIGKGVTGIDFCAFLSCTALQSIVIPDNVISIGQACFAECSSLKSVTLGSGVAEIAGEVFDGCTKLEKIEVDSKNQNYSSDGKGVLFNKEKTTLIVVPVGIRGEYIVPNSVATIGEFAFGMCDNLQKVIVSESVTQIDGWAFSSCINLREIRFKGDAPVLGDWIFNGVTATAYYPAGNETWTESVMQDYEGNITWVSYDASAAIPGDIDGSGEVNRDDVVTLLLHVSMPDAFPLTIPADYNGDGLVTRDDVIQLLLHVSMPDAFPLQ